MRWLLVFDNVRYFHDISLFLPQSTIGSGSIVITSRNALLKSAGICARIMIPPLTPSEGERFLEIDQDSSRDFPSSEVRSAVSALCGGLPILLNFVKALVNAHEYSYSKFLNGFDELNPPWLNDRFQDLHVDRGKIERLYEGTLAGLSPDVRDVICIISLLDGRSIPGSFVSDLLLNSNFEKGTTPSSFTSVDPKQVYASENDTFGGSSQYATYQEVQQFNLAKRERTEDGDVLVMNEAIQRAVRFQMWTASRHVIQPIFERAFTILRLNIRKTTPFREPRSSWTSEYLRLDRHVLSLLNAAKTLQVQLDFGFAELLYDSGFAIRQMHSDPEAGLHMLQEGLAILDGLADNALRRSKLEAGIHTIMNRLYHDMGIRHRRASAEHAQRALLLQDFIKGKTRPDELTRKHEVHYHAARADVAMTILDENHFKEALPILINCLEAHDKWRCGQEVPFDCAKIQYGIAFCKLVEGNHNRALYHAREGSKALTIRGTNNMTTSQEFSLACVLRQVGHFREALNLHHQILNARLASLGEASIPVAQSYYAIGVLHTEYKDFDLAEYAAVDGFVSNLADGYRDALRKSLRSCTHLGIWAEDIVAMAQFQLARVLTSLNRGIKEVDHLISSSRLIATAVLENMDDVCLLEQLQPVLGCRFVKASEQISAPEPMVFSIMQ